MKFDEMIACVPPHGVFRTGQLLAKQGTSTNVVRQLDRWCKAGRVVQLRRGVYAVAPSYVKHLPHPFLVANILKRASYVSLQSALSYYGMIPEYVPTTTSVTTERPERFETPLGRFEFRHTAKHLFTGFYEAEIAPGCTARVASPEKALVDLLYLTPHSDDEALLRELRVTPHSSFENEDVLFNAATASASKKVGRAVTCLFEIWQEEANETFVDTISR